MTDKPTIICDIETYRNFFLIGFKRTSDGFKRYFELSDRATFDLEKVRRIMLGNRIVTFNGQGFDNPLIFHALDGATIEQLKLGADRIINGRVRYWEVEKLLGTTVPRLDHVDLIEPQPNAIASLKTLNGRLHGRKMQDLPYPPDMLLTHEQMDETTVYCGNDLDATHELLDALEEPIALRAALGEKFGMELRSKSDAQMGEAIIKKRVEQLTKQRVERVTTPPGTTFRYQVPPYLRFERADLVAILDRLRETDFIVKADGKVDLPDWLAEQQITIGETTYAMGIGGLHSTEKNRSVHSDLGHVLIDYDVASYYPAIILGSGLYPKTLGPHFLDVYRDIRADRIAAKRAGDKIMDQGFKIALNGCFGKLGSPYSILYAPHLMIAVTLTGQLALLMLIERAEAAGIPVVSGNTDGVVFRCPRHLEGRLTDITKQWEADTGFELESTRYRSLYSQSVNTYIAVKEDGKTKRKGKLMNPRKETMRDQLMHNPNMDVCSDAVVELITKGTPIADYIRGATDIRDFVTVVNVRGGGTWRGGYLGKVVRYIWSKDGEEILYKDPHPTTGNYKKVSKTDGCRPVMELPDELPSDIDYDRYIEAANDILLDIGYTRRATEAKAPRVLKRHAEAWLMLTALAA